MKSSQLLPVASLWLSVLGVAAACSDAPSDSTNGEAGGSESGGGGAVTGGTESVSDAGGTGGAGATPTVGGTPGTGSVPGAGGMGATPASGGATTGGVVVGGTPSGGAPRGGATTGGTATGGAELGGTTTGGALVGGAITGGAPSGGAATGGAGGSGSVSVWDNPETDVVATDSPIRVDLDVAGRPETEVNEIGYLPWVVEGGDSASSTFDGVTFTLRREGSVGLGLRSTYYKAGVQDPNYIRLAGDGVTVEEGNAGGQISLTISGLSAGQHTLLTYHNHVDNPENNTFSPLDISVDGTLVVDGLQPTARLTNAESATAYLVFDVAEGESVQVLFAADTSTSASAKNVFINGFELDTPDASLQATNPSPAHADEHVDADAGAITLSWTPAANAGSHDVYIGTNPAVVEFGDETHSAFRGNQTGATFEMGNLYSMKTYYWRIDEVTASGEVTKGNLWYFRPRQLAFPGAEGHGRFARGGRGGRVVYVTNLDASGPGSLHQAVTEDIGPRTILFNVSGMITLSDRLSLTGSHITVAGQSAPGKGIVVRSAPFGLSGATDVVVRNVRVRLGAGTTYDGMGMAGSNYSIIDRSSISWTIDEAFSSRDAKNITLQRTMIAECLNIADHENYDPGTAHGYAASIGGDIGSFHHNLLAHCAGRNWSLAGGLDGDGNYKGRLDIFNNVVYNWDNRTTDGGAHEVNFVNNYYKPGAATSIFTALNPEYDGFPGTQQYYMSGNVMPGHWDESNQMAGASPDGTPPYELFVSSAFFPSYAQIDSARDAFKRVLSDVGASQPGLDDHDVRVVLETLDGTTSCTGSRSGLPGLPDHENDVGGYEAYPEESRPSDWDSDLDGLPDFWEQLSGTSTSSATGDFSDANADPDLDGYTVLDDYLNWMAEPHYFTQVNAILEIPLGPLFRGYGSSPSYAVTDEWGGSAQISGTTATFSAASCGLASFTVEVQDAEGSSMSKTIGVFVDAAVARTCPP